MLAAGVSQCAGAFSGPLATASDGAAARRNKAKTYWESGAMNVATILKAKGRAVTTARPDATLLDVCTKLASKKIGAIVPPMASTPC